MSMSHVAIQLYTLREEAHKDFIGTLEKVAQIGYEGVEFAGFFDTPAEVLKGHLERLGLKAVGSHTPLEALTTKLDEVIAYNKIIGNKYIVCPWSDIKNLDTLTILVDQLKEAVEILKHHDMELLYHNHDHEFVKIEDVYILDRLYDAFEGGLKAEIDTFWAFRAGVDVSQYLMKHKKLIRMVHLKDGTKDKLAALGEGEAPLHEIVKTVKEIGLEWLIVENDEPYPNGIEDATRSLKYLKAHIL